MRDGSAPNTSIDIRLSGVPEDRLDLPAAAEAAGWVPPGAREGQGVAENGFSSARIWLDVEGPRADARGATDNRARLGEWPGEVPEFPAGLTAQRTGEAPEAS